MVHPIFIICSLMLIQMVLADSQSNSHNEFATDVFRILSKKNFDKNLIYSPASIQSCLSLLFLGAEGGTADELRKSLRLSSADKTTIAKEYGEFLKREFKSTENGPTFRLANRIYVNQVYTIAPTFNDLATTYFNSQAEQINVDDSSKSVKLINGWVESQTENKIQDLLSEGSINKDTTVVLVNAIYFNGKWANKFKLLKEKKSFHISPNQEKKVNFINREGFYKFADLPEFDAKALEVPYANSSLSMLLILPNKVDGLTELETKLANIDLNLIEQKLKFGNVIVTLPKFKIEFEVDLIDPLKELGILKAFTNKAELSGLLQNGPGQEITAVIHKAYIDVNELGTEAAAATAITVAEIKRAPPPKPPTFRFTADHPFVFAIRNQGAVFFAGHVTNP